MILINQNLNLKKSHHNDYIALYIHCFRLGNLDHKKNKNINKDKVSLNQMIQVNDKLDNERKNGVESFNFVFTCENDGSSLEEVNDFLNEYVDSFYNEFFAKGNDKHKLIYKTIHNDEGKPHIHFCISSYNDSLNKWDSRDFMNKDRVQKMKDWEKDFIENKLKNESHKFKWKEPDKELKELRQKHKFIKNNIKGLKAYLEKNKNWISNLIKEKEEYLKDKVEEMKLYQQVNDINNQLNNEEETLNWFNDMKKQFKEDIDNLKELKEQTLEHSRYWYNEAEKLEETIKELEDLEKEVSSNFEKNDFIKGF